jgi:TRAP-type C4-dicarboxylate transport system substrate-binding protein
MSRSAHILVLAGVLAGGVAGADEPHQVLRLATVAPDGTAWAREFRAFSREIEQGSKGALQVKWYYGGIAGNEVEVMSRIERGQLDGAASGGMLCQRAAPSMRVTRVRGLFASRDESIYVMHRLKPVLDAEFAKSGYVHLASTGLGPDIVFSRTPIRSLAELRKAKMWRWDLDSAAIETDNALGFDHVMLPINEAATAYDEGRIDGFYAIPTAALAFQWYTRSKYMLDLRMGYLWGCAVVSQRSFNKLSPDSQRVLLAAAAKLAVRFEEVGQQQDQALVGGLFARQGVTTVAVTPELKAELLAESRTVRDQIGGKLVDPDLLQKVLALLADYRAEHGATK